MTSLYDGVQAQYFHQTALGIPGFRVLDLDDVRTPVRQDRTGSRHKGELSDLENTDTFHRFWGHDRNLAI